jgi:hypothetical protein
MAEQQKPLWLIMDNASWDRMKQGAYAPQDIRAAELRAIADEVVPEEPEPDAYVNTDIGWIVNTPEMHKWEQRMATRDLLLQAAAEAEGKT